MTMAVVVSGCGSVVSSSAAASWWGSVRSTAATSTPVSTISTNQPGSVAAEALGQSLLHASGDPGLGGASCDEHEGTHWP